MIIFILYIYEVIFVPHGWWHMVINLDESIALTHNYVSFINNLYLVLITLGY